MAPRMQPRFDMRFAKWMLALLLAAAPLGCAHVAPVASGSSVTAGGVSDPSPQGSNTGASGANSGSVADIGH